MDRYPNNAPATKQDRKLKIAITIAGVLLVIIIVLIIITSATRSNEEPENYTLEYIREETPTLQIYATINEDMSIEELLNSAKQINEQAEITLYDNGTGSLHIPGQADSIIFSHNLANIDRTEAEVGEMTYDEENEEFTFENEAVSTIEYQPTDRIHDLKYIYELIDGSFVLDYSEEDEMYDFFNLDETYQFSTKSEAIKAYLEPVVTQ